MLTLGGHPRWTMRAGEHDPAPGAAGVFLPGPAPLGRDRALHVDPFAGAIGAGSGFQLGNLVGFPAGGARLVHAVRFSDDHHARCEPGAALVTATPRHELECGAVEELQRLHPAAAAAAALTRHQVPEPGLFDG